MSAAHRPRIRLAAIRWLASWAVVMQAILVRFAPDGLWIPGLAILAVVGAVVRTSPVSFSGRRRALAEAVVGALSLMALGAMITGLQIASQGEARRFFYAPWIALALLLFTDLEAWARLGRLGRVEALKTTRSLLFRVGLGATALVTLLAALTHESLPGETGWTLASSALGTGLFSAEVFMLVLGAIALAGEATGGTMKMMMPHAYRRSDWIVAKAQVLVLAALCFLIVVVVVAVGTASLKAGLGDVTRELEPMFGEETGTTELFESASVMRSHLQDAICAGLAALIATALLGLFLSTVFDGVVPALCAAFLLFACLAFADVVWNLPREAIQGIYTWYPGELRMLTGKLGRALNERWDGALFPEALRLSLLTGSLALLLATGVFSRRDLQV